MENRLEVLHSKWMRKEKFIIGMVHCLPLPGTLAYGNDVEKIYKQAQEDACVLEQAGVDAIIVENTNDKPFSQKLEVEQITMLSALTRMVVECVNIPVGVGASFNDGVSAMAIAYTANASFIRSPVFVDTMYVTGYGTMTPCARDLLRYRSLLKAEHIEIWGDVQVKHSHLVNKEVTLTESAEVAQQYGAASVIVTGLSTGWETPLNVLTQVKETVSIPVIVGSGFHIQNLDEQFSKADGAIVGTAMKKNGDTEQPIDFVLAKNIMDEVTKYNEAHK